MRPKARRRKRSLRRAAIVLLAVGFLLALVAGVVCFNLSSGQLTRRVIAAMEDALEPDCEFSVGRVSFSLAQGFLLKDVRLTPPPAHEGAGFLEVRLIRAVPRLGSLLGGRMSLRSVEVSGCDVTLECGRDGSWNFSRLFKPREGRPPLPGRIVFEGCQVSLCPSCMADLLEEGKSSMPVL